jgi:predicted ATPase
MNNNQKRIVLTGAPGTGKSTIINDLEKRGHICMHEISRDVTLEARKKGTEQLFLTEPLLFSDMLLKGRMEQFLSVKKRDKGLIFYDRGIPDVHAYMNYIGLDYPDRYIKTSQQYKYDFVFLMPPWEEIYITDSERYESFEQALAIHNHLLRAYEELGYTVVEVPTGSVPERTDYILDVIRTFK